MTRLRCRVAAWALAAAFGTGTIGAAAAASVPLAPNAGSEPAPSTDAASTPYTGPLTFDWPVGCAATVQQNSITPLVLADATFAVEATAGTSAPAVIVTSTPAEARIGMGPDGIRPTREVSAYVSNPIIETGRDGASLLAIGYEEWYEQFDADLPADLDDDQLEADITLRTATLTWTTWVGLWAQVGSVTDGAAENVAVELPAPNLQLFTADVDLVAEGTSNGAVHLLATWESTDSAVSFPPVSMEVVIDPTSLQPYSASAAATIGDGSSAPTISYVWAFDWSACDGAPRLSEIASAASNAPGSPAERPSPSSGPVEVSEPESAFVTVAGFDTVTLDELPPEALETLALIESDGPFPYRQDGATFENREGLLPDQPFGYYLEYTVETPGSDDRGARRIVAGYGGELFYTDDHYDSFRVIVEKEPTR